MRRLSLVTPAVALLALVPSAAQARWSPSLALPSVPANDGTLIGTVDDHGRAVVTYTSTNAGTRLVRLTARGPGRLSGVAGVGDTETLALLADGTAVGVGSREVTPSLPSPWPACCTEPVVFRLPAAGGAVATQDQPAGLPEGNWGADAPVIAPDGTVTILASLDDGITGDSPNHYVVESARAGDPAIALAGAPFVLTQATATAAHALSAGRVAIAWRGRHEIHELILRDGTPEINGAFSAGYAGDETLAVNGFGRVVRAGESGGRLWLWTEARGRHLLARHYGGVNAYMLIGGPHNTATVAFIDRDRVRLASLDHDGRHFHVPVTLGRRPTTAPPEMPPLVAIDTHDAVHVAWATRGGGIVIHGPHGTHHIRTRHTAELTDLQVSPPGAELVLWRAGRSAFAALSSP